MLTLLRAKRLHRLTATSSDISVEFSVQFANCFRISCGNAFDLDVDLLFWIFGHIGQDEFVGELLAYPDDFTRQEINVRGFVRLKDSNPGAVFLHVNEV